MPVLRTTTLLCALALVASACTVTTRTSRASSGTTVQQQGGTQTVETQSSEDDTAGDEEPATLQRADAVIDNETAPVEQPEVQEVEEPPRQRPVAVPPPAAAGRPPGLTGGAGIAYWIWRSDDEVWHLRTTSDGEPHVFRGSIRTSGNALENLTPANADQTDRWRTHGNGGLSFAFNTVGGTDGLDFKPSARCFRLLLKVDDAPAETVYTGSEATQAEGHFIRLCSPR